MKDPGDPVEDLIRKLEADALRGRFNPARIFSVPEDVKCLDTAQLAELENSFRQWADKSARADIRVSRRRILLIFLLIRYTGARLNEILTLNDQQHIDLENHLVHIGKSENSGNDDWREVQIPAQLAEVLKEALNDPASADSLGSLFKVDPGHVRRKFYERAQSCGLERKLGNPNVIRRSRAVELLRGNMPLPVVQKLLGHSTPNLAGSYVDFTAEDMRLVTRHFIEKENRRRTSARNTFFGKITRIKKGDIQSEVELVTLGGDTVITVITNDSLQRLGLKPNSFVTAEVKAPWVIIAKEDVKAASAENKFQGCVSRVIRGEITTEFVVRIADGTELCTVVTRQSSSRLEIKKNDVVWVMFNAFAVILNIE